MGVRGVRGHLGGEAASAARVMAKRVWQVWRTNHSGVGATVPPLNSAPCGSFLSGKKEKKVHTHTHTHVLTHNRACAQRHSAGLSPLIC